MSRIRVISALGNIRVVHEVPQVPEQVVVVVRGGSTILRTQQEPKGTMEEIDERLGDEVEAAEVPEAGAGEGEADPTPAPADVESIEEILVKKEEAEDEAEEDESSLLAAPRDERVETLSVKVVPPQASEFVCARCRLVKHRSQLADKGRMLCRDCA